LVTAQELRQRAQVNVADSAADSAADEEGVVLAVEVAGAGVSVFNFNEGSATSGIPVNSPTNLVEVLVEGMVKAKAKDLGDLTEHEDGVEEVTVAVEEAEAMLAGHHLEEEAEVMAVVEHHRRDILPTAVSRVAVAEARMGNREVVDMVNSHRLLLDTDNKDQRTAMDNRGPAVDTDNKGLAVDTDNRVEASRHMEVNREAAEVHHTDSHSLTVTDNREDQLLLAAIHNRVAVEDKVDIINREPGEAEVTVSSQGLVMHHLQEVLEDMVNRTIQHQAGILEVEEVATDSSNNHLLHQTATGAVEATPSSTKLAIRRLFSQDITEPCSWQDIPSSKFFLLIGNETPLWKFYPLHT